MTSKKNKVMCAKVALVTFITLFVLCLVLIACSDSSTTVQDVSGKHFRIDKNYYETLQEAIDSISTESKLIGINETIVMLMDTEGPGAYIDKSCKIDFGQYSYTIVPQNDDRQEKVGFYVAPGLREVELKASDVRTYDPEGDAQKARERRTLQIGYNNKSTEAVLKIYSPVIMESLKIDINKNSASSVVTSGIIMEGEYATLSIKGSTDLYSYAEEERRTNQNILVLKDRASFTIDDQGATVHGNIIATNESVFNFNRAKVELFAADLDDSVKIYVSSLATVLAYNKETVLALRKLVEEASTGAVRCAYEKIHEWDAGVITKAASSGAAGERLYTCALCGVTKTVPITLCKNGSHNYKPTTSRTNCVIDYYGPAKCSVCGDFAAYTTVTAIDHIYGEWKEIVAPLCLEKGEEKQTCLECGHYTTQTVAALGHDWTVHLSRTDCELENEGVEFICTRCSATDIQLVSATDHHFDFESSHAWKDPEETCTEEGKLYITCTDCLQTSWTTIEPHPHEFHWDAVSATDINPTCTTTGSSYTVCSECGTAKTYTDIPALGHEFDWSTSETVIFPTCCTTGTNSAKCIRCDETTTTDTDIVPTAHHFDWEGNVFTSPSTCSAKGYKLTTCTNGCKTTTVTELEIDPNGHKFSELWTSDTEKHWHVCEYCGEAHSVEGAHDFERETLTADVDVTGYTTDTCSVCGYTSVTSYSALKVKALEDVVGNLSSTMDYLHGTIYVDDTHGSNATKSKMGENKTYTVADLKGKFQTFKYYVPVAKISSSYGSNLKVTLGDTEYSSSDNSSLSVGSNNYIVDKVFVVEDNILKIAPEILSWYFIDGNGLFKIAEEELEFEFTPITAALDLGDVYWETGSTNECYPPSGSETEYTMTIKDDVFDKYIVHIVNGVSANYKILTKWTMNNAVTYAIAYIEDFGDDKFGVTKYPFTYGSNKNSLTNAVRAEFNVCVLGLGKTTYNYYFDKAN